MRRITIEWETWINEKPVCLVCYRNKFSLALNRQFKTPSRILVLARRRVNVCSSPSSNTSSILTTHLKSPSVTFNYSAFTVGWNEWYRYFWLFLASFVAAPSQLRGIPNRWKRIRDQLHIKFRHAPYLQQPGNICWVPERSAAYPLFTVKDHAGQKTFSKSSAAAAVRKAKIHRRRTGETKGIVALLCHCNGREFLGVQMIWERSEGPEKYLYSVFILCFTTWFEMSHFRESPVRA